MSEFVKGMNQLPLVLKIILALPMFDIVWGLYKVFDSYDKKNMVMFIVWIVIYVTPIAFAFSIVDLVTLCIEKNVRTFNDVEYVK